MSFDEARRDGGILPDRALCADAAEECRESQQSHAGKNHQARSLEVIGIANKRNNKESKHDNRADDWNMIKYQMEVREINRCFLNVMTSDILYFYNTYS